MLGKDKLLDKQRRLVEQKDQLKDKLTYIKDTIKKGGISTSTSFIKKDLIPKSLNPKKPLPSVLAHHTANSSAPQIQPKTTKSPLTKVTKNISAECTEPGTGNSTPKSLKIPIKHSKDNLPSTLQESDETSMLSEDYSSTQKSFGNIQSVGDSEEPRRIKKQIKRKQKLGNNDLRKSKYFPAGFMADYWKQVGTTSFSLPLKEYRELMHLKSEVETRLKNNATALDETLKLFSSDKTGPEGEKVRLKCFSQISQSLECNPSDGVVCTCFMNNKYLVIAQTNKIHVYTRQNSPKEWSLKDSMIRLRIQDSIKQMIVPCILNKKETIVLCEVYLVKDPNVPKFYLKLAQYRFFTEAGKVMKDFVLGSFDCELEHFESCQINRRACTIGVSAWATQQSRSIAWIFSHAGATDSMRCTPMVPVKHEIASLHDISIATSKTMLLGFGSKSFTVWNGKTGERFIFVNLSKLGPVKTMSCLYGVFAVIQKGFIFLIVGVKDKLHMVAVNMGTGLFKSLRQFKMPRDQTCLKAIVKDDKLIGVTNTSVICWSLYNSFKLQQLKMDSKDIAYLMKKKVLIFADNKFKRILLMKSADEIRNAHSNVSNSAMSMEDVDEVSTDNNDNEETPQQGSSKDTPKSK